MSESFLKNSKIWNTFPEEYIPMTEKLVLALQYYADQSNWYDRSHGEYTIINNDNYFAVDKYSTEYGGKRAREVLTELGLLPEETT